MEEAVESRAGRGPAAGCRVDIPRLQERSGGGGRVEGGSRPRRVEGGSRPRRGLPRGYSEGESTETPRYLWRAAVPSSRAGRGPAAGRRVDIPRVPRRRRGTSSRGGAAAATFRARRTDLGAHRVSQSVRRRSQKALGRERRDLSAQRVRQRVRRRRVDRRVAVPRQPRRELVAVDAPGLVGVVVVVRRRRGADDVDLRARANSAGRSPVFAALASVVFFLRRWHASVVFLFCGVGMLASSSFCGVGVPASSSFRGVGMLASSFRGVGMLASSS